MYLFVNPSIKLVQLTVLCTLTASFCCSVVHWWCCSPDSRQFAFKMYDFTVSKKTENKIASEPPNYNTNELEVFTSALVISRPKLVRIVYWIVKQIAPFTPSMCSSGFDRLISTVWSRSIDFSAKTIPRKPKNVNHMNAWEWEWEIEGTDLSWRRPEVWPKRKRKNTDGVVFFCIRSSF